MFVPASFLLGALGCLLSQNWQIHLIDLLRSSWSVTFFGPPFLAPQMKLVVVKKTYLCNINCLCACPFPLRIESIYLSHLCWADDFVNLNHSFCSSYKFHINLYLLPIFCNNLKGRSMQIFFVGSFEQEGVVCFLFSPFTLYAFGICFLISFFY